jgi:hypothetical protein
MPNFAHVILAGKKGAWKRLYSNNTLFESKKPQNSEIDILILRINYTPLI